ncbi:MAG: MFS transporter, partial [Nanoarchaeota archaeon]|nr:MFS transporter [Nanoarchaeota archaeon]
MLLLFKENPLIMKFSLFQIIYRLSIGIIVPFFSLILNQAGWSISEITYFFSLAAFVIFFLGPIIGRVADEIGKKKVIVFGLSIQMIFFLLYYFTIDHIYLTYTIRFFEIVSFICVGVVGIGALEDLIGKRKRGFFTGLILGIGTLGSLLGPILAGYIAQYFEAKVLFLFAVPLTFLSILFILLLPEFKLSNKK